MTLVRVCSACKRASCLTSYFYRCKEERLHSCAVIALPVEDLEELALEHPSWWYPAGDLRAEAATTRRRLKSIKEGMGVA